ncbi:hypothetical protein ABPG74_005394 [Tetrahymena malaccensis]
MGKSLQKDNRRSVKGNIFINLSKTAFISNEVIEGTLSVNLEEPFQGHCLQVTLMGLEETRFTFRLGSQKSKRNVNASGFNKLLNFSIPVYDFAKESTDTPYVIQPCQVQIPFKLTIADKLPSSIKYFLDQNNRCNLKYTLVASIIPTEVSVKPVSGSQEIFIGQLISTQQFPNTITSIQKPVVGCCSKSGEINYSVTSNSRSFSPNESINLKIKIDLSQYGNNIKKINVRLLGQLNMKSNLLRNKYFNIFDKSVDLQVNNSQFNQEVLLSVPANASLTSLGNLIQLNYYIQIKPVIDNIFCCTSKNKPHEFKIYINPNSSKDLTQQPIPQQQQIQAPQNWNPQQLQPVQFSQQQAEVYQQQQLQFFAQEQQLYYQQMDIIPNQQQQIQSEIDYQQQMILVQQYYLPQMVYISPVQQPQQQIQTQQHIIPQVQAQQVYYPQSNIAQGYSQQQQYQNQNLLPNPMMQQAQILPPSQPIMQQVNIQPTGQPLMQNQNYL